MNMATSSLMSHCRIMMRQQLDGIFEDPRHRDQHGTGQHGDGHGLRVRRRAWSGEAHQLAQLPLPSRCGITISRASDIDATTAVAFNPYRTRAWRPPLTMIEASTKRQSAGMTTLIPVAYRRVEPADQTGEQPTPRHQ